MTDAVNGVLTESPKRKYTQSQLAGDTASVSERVAGRDEDIFNATLEKLRASGPAGLSLPKFEDHPDWVFAWVSTDPRMSSDNAMTRLQNGWQLATRELQPRLVQAMSAAPDYHAASAGATITGAIQWKDVVALMLPRQAHEAWLHYFHTEAPAARNNEFVQLERQTAEFGTPDRKASLASGRDTKFNRQYERN